MPTSIGYATLQVIPSAKGFSAALDGQVHPSMAASGRKSGGLMGAGMVGGLAKAAGPLAAAAGAFAVAGFLKGAVSEASNLAESVNAVNVAYGKAGAEVNALGKKSARTFGLSTVQMNEQAVRFSAFSEKIAGTGGDVAGTFEKIMGRATDFASVMNLEVNDSAQLFSSGLAGEAESLRRYGIDVSSATVETFAYANGIAAAGEDLTEAQKVQARYGTIMEQTNKFAGDFANTSGGLANQQRILSAQWDNMKATVGNALLPVVTKFVTFLNDKAIPGLKGVWTAVKPVIDVLQGVAKILLTGDFDGGLFSAAGIQEDGALVDFLFDVREALMAFWKVVTTQIIPALQSFGEKGSTIFGQVSEILTTTVFPAIAKVWKVFQENLLPILAAVQAFIIEHVVPAYLTLAQGISDFITKARPFIDLMVGFYTFMYQAYAVIAGFLIPIFLKLAGPIFSFLIGAIAKVLGWLGSFLGFLGNLPTKVAEFIGAVVRKFGEFVETVKSLPGKALAAVSGIGSTLLSAGGDLISGFIKGIKDKAGGIVDTIKRYVTDKIPDFVKTAFGIDSPSKVMAELGKWTMLGFTQGIADNADSAQLAMGSAIAPPAAPSIVAGGLVGAFSQSTAAASAASGPSVARLYLDGRQIAESVFDTGSRDLAYGRRGF